MTTILHMIDTTGPGGAETVFVELVDRCRAEGFRPIAVLRGPGWVAEALQRRGIRPRFIKTRGALDWRYVRTLRALIREEKVDLIQAHLLGSNLYGALAGRTTGRPVVGTFHGMVDVSPDERFRTLKRWVMQRGIHRYVTVSEHLAEEISRRRLLDPARTTVIHNGIDLSRYERPRHRALAEQLGLPPGAIVAGSLGNVRPAKGYDVLVRAARLLAARFPELHFVVAGDPRAELMRTLESLMDETGTRDRVHFLGFTDDAPGFLAGLDLFVLPSISEGFSISTIEAMAVGVPVIATRSGGPEEILEPDVTGLLVAPGDPQALADGICELLEAPEQTRDRAARARDHAQATYSMERMVRSYAAIWNQCLTGMAGHA